MTTTSTTDETLRSAIEAMNAGTNLFDATIVCTTDDHQAEYWMDKFRNGLLATKSKNSGGGGDGDEKKKNPYPIVLAVSEDWNDPGGAGNGLGTLYAYRKAAALAKELYGVDLDDALSRNLVSAALYHTAGKGTRLAPLPASENNNKPGVVRFCFAPLASFFVCCPARVWLFFVSASRSVFFYLSQYLLLQ